MNWHDPTAIDIAASGVDPMTARLTGWTTHGNIPINTTYITKVAENLYHGGVESWMTLPENIKFVLALYPETYVAGFDVEVKMEKMYDSVDQNLDHIDALAYWVNDRRKQGDVLVHCQAGLNRSSVVVARALFLSGEVDTGQEAIDMLRFKRSPAVLCNPRFEEWVRNMSKEN